MNGIVLAVRAWARAFSSRMEAQLNSRWEIFSMIFSFREGLVA
jgi:hypothetical protein